MANPLDRTWYNTLIDDTGDGMSGTVWNKAQVDGLLDTVDASLAPVVVNPSPVDLTIAKVEPRLVLQYTGSTTKGRIIGAVADWVALTLNANYTGAWARDDAAKEGLALALTPTAGFRVVKVDAAGIETNLVTVNPAGLVTLTGGQLKFPATAVPSADLNTLDDYEEFTWSPTITGTGGGSGQGYAAQRGGGVKIGRWVHVTYDVSLNVLGTISGNAVIGGLPFSTDTGAYLLQHARIEWHALGAAYVNMCVQLEPSLPTGLRLLGMTAAATSSIGAPVPASALTASSGFYGSILYRSNG